MSDDASWYPEGGPPRRQPERPDPQRGQPPRPNPPGGRPPGPPQGPPPSGRGTGAEWALPIIFLASVGILFVSIPGRFFVADMFGNLVFPAGMLATGTGIAVVVMRPDRSLPERTRSALQAVRVVAGVFLGLVVAFLAFVAYLVGQILNDPNTE